MVDRVRLVEWSRAASVSLDEAITYINETSPQNARAVLNDTLRAAASLSRFAERGRLVPERPAPPTRELFVHGFRLVYELTEAHVTILAFIRGRRRFPVDVGNGGAR